MTTTSVPTGALGAPPMRRQRRDWRGWAFVAPFLIIFAATILAPLAYAIYISFFREQLIGGNAFVGLQNYLRVFQDPKFYQSLGRVALFFVIQVPVMVVLALAAALALDSARLYGSSFFRIAIFLPYAVPGVVAALIWGFIYGDRFGLTASINNVLGGNVLQPFSSDAVLFSIANIVTWEFLGYNMLIFFAALRVVPTEVYEAAEIDGANAWRVVTNIKIPSLRGAIVIATVFSIIGSFQLFNEPNLLQTLAPNVISSFWTPNMYAYNLSFAGQQFNYAATVAIVMGLLTAAIAYVVQVRGSREENR
ncbi:MAG TPA: sugar ABC transporter permease [Propionibacteriaceae bacterium]